MFVYGQLEAADRATIDHVRTRRGFDVIVMDKGAAGWAFPHRRSGADGRIIWIPKRCVCQKKPDRAAHSPPRITGSRVPLSSMPSILRSADPIMKSTWAALLLPPACANASSLIASPPLSVNL